MSPDAKKQQQQQQQQNNNNNNNNKGVTETALLTVQQCNHKLIHINTVSKFLKIKSSKCDMQQQNL